jgi:hypothetical protein
VKSNQQVRHLAAIILLPPPPREEYDRCLVAHLLVAVHLRPRKMRKGRLLDYVLLRCAIVYVYVSFVSLCIYCFVLSMLFCYVCFDVYVLLISLLL